MGCGDIFRSCLPLKKTNKSKEERELKKKCTSKTARKLLRFRKGKGGVSWELPPLARECQTPMPCLESDGRITRTLNRGPADGNIDTEVNLADKKRTDIIQERIEKLKKYDERNVDERRAEMKKKREEHLKKKSDLEENNVRGMKISRVHRRQKAAKEKDVVVPGAVYDHEDDFPKANTSNATVGTSVTALSSNSSLSTLSVYSSRGEEESWEAWEERMDDELFYA